MKRNSLLLGDWRSWEDYVFLCVSRNDGNRPQETEQEKCEDVMQQDRHLSKFY